MSSSETRKVAQSEIMSRNHLDLLNTLIKSANQIQQTVTAALPETRTL